MRELVQSLRHELQEAAFRLGRRINEERPEHFTRRVAGHVRHVRDDALAELPA
jgi:hypothetical protein